MIIIRSLCQTLANRSQISARFKVSQEDRHLLSHSTLYQHTLTFLPPLIGMTFQHCFIITHDSLAFFTLTIGMAVRIASCHPMIPFFLSFFTILYAQHRLAFLAIWGSLVCFSSFDCLRFRRLLRTAVRRFRALVETLPLNPFSMLCSYLLMGQPVSGQKNFCLPF